jgi:5-oxoprolinase (ATP-hydrolysing)
VTGARWRFFVDRGGTFTDCIAIPPDGGAPVVRKLLSTDDAPLVAIRSVLGLAADAAIPPLELRLGTTVATNALLERRGRRSLLVVTRGFGDLLRIGDQTRPEIFALAIRTPAVLHDAVLEVDARADQRGEVLERPEPHALSRALADAVARGIDSAAIVVVGGWIAPQLEREIAALAREAGFAHVVCSHEIGPQIGLLARGDTAMVDAYTTPLVADYLAALVRALPGSDIQVMQSSGGLAPVSRIRGRDMILSGPAGGVLAVAAIAQTHGLVGAIGFDMGGTSTDVCRIERGEPERTWETHTAGVRIRVPMLAVHTIAAGGGSICTATDGRLQVGPHSAGASPGPLCYGDPHASQLALTDINLALGRIVGDRFPIPLQRERVDTAITELRTRLHDDALPTDAAIADGFFRVATHAMAEAIRRVTIARGHDVRDDALVVFGGAAGQHACAVAELLGLRSVLVHPQGGVLSAWGIGGARPRWTGQADLGLRLLDDDSIASANARAAELVADGRRALDENTASAAAWIELRHPGTDTALAIPLHADIRAAFRAMHLGEYGWVRDDAPIECVAVRVQVDAAGTIPTLPAPLHRDTPLPRRHAPLFCRGAWHDAAVFDRESIGRGATIHGPALVLDDTGTFVLEPGWSLAIADDGTMLARTDAPAHRTPDATTRDPVTLEIFAHRFMAIAEQMGTVLRRTASSTNIRERLDFSCAVFDADANLVANAPHLPVHLGAMGESVAAVARAHPHPRDGDVFATNDPTAGGSHLPDITVVTPVFVDGGLAFWVASRGHHADVGGITPGSMPPFATHLHEEGVVLRALPIVRDGVLLERDLREALAQGPWPARRPDENVADLRAQIAANQAGARALHALVASRGLAAVTAYMAHVQDQAAQAVSAAIARLPRGRHGFVDITDDGVRIEVAIEITEGTLAIDFAGTSPAQPSNLNAPRAVTVAAVLYVLRTLVGAPIPLNKGCLRPVTLAIPPGSLLDPSPEHAVAAGNVETSQRIVDVLFAALGIKAASQGTMNNLTFGDATFGYYETIGGGEGATADHDGASGVHTHMTNTRITDAEVLEARYPVRVRRFALHTGSGGAGSRRGGDGLVRELEVLAPLEVAMLSDRRSTAAFGLAGGEAGASGRNLVDGAPGAGRFAITVPAGTRLTIETPGGGGFGRRSC